MAETISAAALVDGPEPAALPTPRYKTALGFGVFVVGHMALALVMRRAPILGVAHALLCLFGGVFVALRYPARVTALVIAYASASEVLWRMTHAALVWEFGKYTVSAIIIAALFRMTARRNRAPALIYLVLLSFSVALTVSGATDLDYARQLISFNLSGPISLALCIIFFSNLKVTDSDLRELMFIVIGPLAGIAMLGFFSISSHDKISFINASNSVASGGFGPNQVSAVLGLGVLVIVLLQLQRKMRWQLRLPLILLAVFFAAQSAITFSRSGLAMAFASSLAAIAYLARDGRTRITIILLATVLALVGKFVVVPELETLTKGKFEQRYSEVETDGRTKLMRYDLEIFSEHPLLGVGPGMATELRDELGHLGAAHTEFTRMLAEHGIAGAIALILMVSIWVRVFFAPKILRYRALVAAFLSWGVLFLLIDGMRTVAPSFAIGVACTIAYSFNPKRALKRRRPTAARIFS